MFDNNFYNESVGILEESLGIKILNLNDYDKDGIVFGRPDQVEIGILIKDSLVIICEIRFSMSKAKFYQQKYQRTVNRKIVISPIVESNSFPVAESLGIEVYSNSHNVPIEK